MLFILFWLFITLICQRPNMLHANVRDNGLCYTRSSFRGTWPIKLRKAQAPYLQIDDSFGILTWLVSKGSKPNGLLFLLLVNYFVRKIMKIITLFLCPKKVLSIDLAARTSPPSLIPRGCQVPKCFTRTSMYILYGYQYNIIFSNVTV